MKKIVAFLLAAVMVVSLLPMTVFAVTPTYTVTNGRPGEMKNTYNGYIDFDNDSAHSGDIFTLNLVPNDGYMVEPNSVKYWYEDTDGTKHLNATKVDDTTYTFTMPTADVTVAADFVKIGSIITEVDIAVKESLTRDDLKNPPTDIASITKITEGNEDVKCDVIDYLILDKDKTPIYRYDVKDGCWYDAEGQVVSEPKFDDMMYAMTYIRCIHDKTKEGGFASELTVRFNGGEPLKAVAIENLEEGYEVFDTDTLMAYKVFDLNPKTTEEVKAATNVPAGDATSMTLWIVVLAISIMGVAICFPFIKKNSSK